MKLRTALLATLASAAVTFGACDRAAFATDYTPQGDCAGNATLYQTKGVADTLHTWTYTVNGTPVGMLATLDGYIVHGHPATITVIGKYWRAANADTSSTPDTTVTIVRPVTYPTDCTPLTFPVLHLELTCTALTVENTGDDAHHVKVTLSDGTTVDWGTIVNGTTRTLTFTHAGETATITSDEGPLGSVTQKGNCISPTTTSQRVTSTTAPVSSTTAVPPPPSSVPPGPTPGTLPPTGAPSSANAMLAFGALGIAAGSVFLVATRKRTRS